MQLQSEQQIRNLKTQSEQQIYSRIMDARLKLESTETFTKMAKESPIFAERFTVVDNPDEYYSVVAFLDLFEFLFRLNKRDMIDAQIWSRWKGLAKTIMTIPKLREYGRRQRMSMLMNSENLLIHSTTSPYDICSSGVETDRMVILGNGNEYTGNTNHAYLKYRWVKL
jgi:hypothetical protein